MPPECFPPLTSNLSKFPFFLRSTHLDKSYGLYTPKRAIVVELLIKLLQEPLVENIISVVRLMKAIQPFTTLKVPGQSR